MTTHFVPLWPEKERNKRTFYSTYSYNNLGTFGENDSRSIRKGLAQYHAPDSCERLGDFRKRYWLSRRQRHLPREQEPNHLRFSPRWRRALSAAAQRRLDQRSAPGCGR